MFHQITDNDINRNNKNISKRFIGPLTQKQTQRLLSSAVKLPKKKVNKAPRVQSAMVNIRGGMGRLGLSSSNSSGSKRVQKTLEDDEYIAEISGSVAFATTAYPVNPGQALTFPWGNKIASLYEKYSFSEPGDFIEFYYRREVSEYATNGQAGKVMLSFDYDASDNPPSTKMQVLDTVPHVDGMPSMEEIRLRLDPREMRTQDSYYVRPGTQPANTDIKTYDVGNLYVSTYGCTNTSVIGELRVRYRCTLKVPVLESPATVPAPGSYLLMTGPALGETGHATTAKNLLFGSTNGPVIINNSIGAVLGSTGAITLLAGTYLVECNYTGVNSAETLSSTTLWISDGTAYTNYTAYFADGSTSADALNCCTTATPIVWNTASRGLVIGLWLELIFASGTSYTFPSLKITAL